jgi:acetyl-CoA acyltransferase
MNRTTRHVNEVVVVDAVRTPFGRAGEKGVFWRTRAEDLCVPLLKALIERNPAINPQMVDDIIWGVSNQIAEQGGNLGRLISMLADWGWGVPGCSVDRACAGGLTTISLAASWIASGMADCMVAGGVEHMGHIPMGYMRDSHPRLSEVIGGSSALNMGMTAENIHDRFPEFTREMADRYAVESQRKTDAALKRGKMNEMIIPIEVVQEDGTRVVIQKDQLPRPDTSMEGLAGLKTPFREDGGRVTAGNASPLTDGAGAVLLMNAETARELGLQPKMRWVVSAVSGVDPTIMGTAPVPATQKALRKAGLSMDDIDILEMNEAFAVQCLYCLDELGLEWDAPKVNMWGGSIAYGHPLAASGTRLVAFLAGLFKENRNSRYGLTTMCAARGQGYTAIWENLCP